MPAPDLLPDRPRRPVGFDHFGNVARDVLSRRCERRDGELVNGILKRYADVSNFRTCDEKAFLADPVY